MKAQVYNLSGVVQRIPGGGSLTTASTVQYITNLSDGFFNNKRATSGASSLLAKKASGLLDFQYVRESHEVGFHGLKKLHLTYARSHFNVASTSTTLTDDCAFPAGAVVTKAWLQVHTALTGGSVSAVVAKCGLDSDDDAFDASEDVYTGATVRQLTATGTLGVVGGHVGGLKLMVTLTSTGANLAALTAGDIELWVDYTIAAAL